MKDYETAKSSLKDAILADEKMAIAYYVSAINAAKMSDEEAMGADLKEAVSKDASLKEKALKDLEFKGFWEKESFKSALN